MPLHHPLRESFKERLEHEYIAEGVMRVRFDINVEIEQVAQILEAIIRQCVVGVELVGDLIGADIALGPDAFAREHREIKGGVVRDQDDFIALEEILDARILWRINE